HGASLHSQFNRHQSGKIGLAGNCRWQKAEGRSQRKRRLSAICHLPSAICHLPPFRHIDVRPQSLIECPVSFRNTSSSVGSTDQRSATRIRASDKHRITSITKSSPVP